jgi:serine protease
MKKILLVCFGVVLILVLALGFPANAEEGNADNGIAANALITENPVDGKSGNLESGELDTRAPRDPPYREVVIVYFAEMPPSLEGFGLKYGGKLIFAKEDIKMAAFETNSVATIGAINQQTLDFVGEVSRDPCIEKAFRDTFMFIRSDKEYSTRPKITYPQEYDEKGLEYTHNKVEVGFWRLPPSLEEFASKYGGRIVLFEEELLFVSVEEVSDVAEFIRKVSSDPYVSYAHPPLHFKPAVVNPNDEFWNDQWGPQNIYCPNAWDEQLGSTAVTVAILDTGVDYNHVDLGGRVIQGDDFASPNPDDHDPMDDDIECSHGTQMAGIVAATINNGSGIAGIAQSQILAVKVLRYRPYIEDGPYGEPAWVAAGINYASGHGADIINMSFTGESDPGPIVQQACDHAYYDHYCLLFGASGNNGTGSVLWPAAYWSVWAVGATDSSDQRCAWSNYGSDLDLVAPGDNIISLFRGNQVILGPPEFIRGTSHACAHVSGVAALVWSENPAFQVTKVRDVLFDTAVDLGSSGWDQYYGFGKVNAYNAVYLGKLHTSRSGTLSGTGQTYTYSTSVPAPKYVTVVMAGNQAGADFDLYVKWGSPPTQYDFDGGSASSTSLEWCTVKGPGTLYVMVRSYSGSGNWKSWVVTGASYIVTSSRKSGSLSSGQSATYYTIGEGVGYAFSSGPDTGNFDLYIRWNTPPTTSLYDARGYTAQSQEIAGPKNGYGTLYFMVRSRSGTGYYSAVGMIF